MAAKVPASFKDGGDGGAQGTLMKSMTLTPAAYKLRNIAVAGRELALAWGDGEESYLPFDDLRRRCPCAVCRGTRETETVADPLRVVKAPARGEITIKDLVPVGAYAVQIVW